MVSRQPGCGRDDELVELFHRPTAVHEPLREMIEQAGVSGQTTGAAEIIGIAGQAFAEMPGPHAVDHDSGGEGIFFIDDPAGEGETTFAHGVGKRLGVQSAESFRGA